MTSIINDVASPFPPSPLRAVAGVNVTPAARRSAAKKTAARATAGLASRKGKSLVLHVPTYPPKHGRP